MKVLKQMKLEPVLVITGCVGFVHVFLTAVHNKPHNKWCAREVTFEQCDTGATRCAYFVNFDTCNFPVGYRTFR